MRLIDADKLKNDISWFDHHETVDITVRRAMSAIDEQPTVDAQEIITELQMEKTDLTVELKSLEAIIADLEEMRGYEKHYEWISVEETLPEKPPYGEIGYIVQQNNVIEPYSAYWDGETWTDLMGDEINGVVAWMPLPEPFRKKVE